MLVFDKDLFQEYCRVWEPAYYKNPDAIRWAEKTHNKEVKSYNGGQYLYVDDGKGGKDLMLKRWCKEV